MSHNELFDLVTNDSPDAQVPMIVVHMSETELQSLDALQGGRSLDEGTGLPEYARLVDVMKMSGIKELFKRVLTDLELPGHLDNDPSLKEAYTLNKDDIRHQHHPMPPGLADTEAHQGQDGDNKLALLPVKVADFFDELRGGMDLNTHTGLRQYGFLDSILNVVGSIGHSVMNGAKGLFGGLLSSKSPSIGPGYGYVSGATPGLYQELAQAGMLSGMGGFGSLMGAGNMMNSAPSGGGLLSNLVSSPLLPLLWAGLKGVGAHRYEKENKEIRKQHNASVRKMLKDYGYGS